MSFHILELLHDSSLSIFIIYYQCARCDHFILLSLYNIYLFLCSCHYFYKNILN